MMLDWDQYRKQIRETTAEIARISPDIVRGYRTLSDAGLKTSVLGAKTRELISLAVAVTRQCDGCIAVHTDAALKAGATREEMIDALLSGKAKYSSIFNYPSLTWADMGAIGWLVSGLRCTGSRMISGTRMDSS